MNYSKQLQDFVLAVKSGDFVILDTETTDLEIAEAVQIAVINADGDVLVDTLLKPVNTISQGAIGIHSIDVDMVKDAPTWDEIWPEVHSCIAGRELIVYNANFDKRVLYQTTKHLNQGRIDWGSVATWRCAMHAFAEFYGDWNQYRRSYRWQNLLAAVDFFGGYHIKQFHGALPDCQHTLFVSREIVKAVESGERDGDD